jgi:hypothetical protein
LRIKHTVSVAARHPTGLAVDLDPGKTTPMAAAQWLRGCGDVTTQGRRVETRDRRVVRQAAKL